jgi:hypothetical protein
MTVALTAGPALAFPHIDTISSETLSTVPFRVKTTFTIQLVGYEPHSYWAIRVESGSGPVVQFFDCGAPANWLCGSYAPGSTDYLEFVPPNSGPWPWPGVMTFFIVTDQAAPCVSLDFYNGILSKTPRVNEDFVVEGCLVVDAPTPAAMTSWGQMKAIYR